MCGICGQFNYATGRPVDRDDLVAAASKLAHRGPDDEGYFLSGSVGLGFRRLSIIDLAGGHQPMSDREESVWVVFNGEVYNFPDLRAELQGKGHVFRTRSDTEVIVHGYKEWGDLFLDRIRGMFALAVWDVARRRLLVARDAMGIKPIYYRVDRESVFFASEIRALSGGAHCRPEVDAASLNLFLRYRYTPSPRTLFKGVRKLAPGAMMIVQDGAIRIERWYQFVPRPFDSSIGLEEAARELLERYRSALRRHLVSDVPVGLLLSGGMDSALLLALMTAEGGGWNTYSVGYGTSFKDDELEDAQRTADLFSSKHVAVELSRADFDSLLPEVITSLEEPVAASSIVPMYVVCRRARQDVKVALVGQGPDELFGGYTRHLGVAYGRFWRSAPAWFQKAISSVIFALPRAAALKRGVHALGVPDRLERYREVLSVLPGVLVDGLFRPGVIPAGAADEVIESWGALVREQCGTNELSGFQWLELQSSLPDELLMYTDKMSMAHGLEVRVPYLDRDVVEFGQRLDSALKIRWGTRKLVHRKVCASYLPPEVIRRKKRGFAANVVDGWFSQSVGASTDGILLDESSLMYGLLEPTAVKRLLDQHKSGRADNHKVLFSLVLLEQWMRGHDSSLRQTT
jgi:asparagine synthase (glutamine-hydrolysing)